MWTIEETINRLLMTREIAEPVVRKTDGIEDCTSKQIIDVVKLKELFDVSSRVRNRLEALRSYWVVSLVCDIDDYLSTFCKDDAGYQIFFIENQFPVVGFHSYNLKYSVFNKAVKYLEDKRYLFELNEILKFLRSLETWNTTPLSDEALKSRFSS